MGRQFYQYIIVFKCTLYVVIHLLPAYSVISSSYVEL